MVLFNNILYKHVHLTSRVNLTKRFSEKYKHMSDFTVGYFPAKLSICLAILNLARQIYYTLSREIFY